MKEYLLFTGLYSHPYGGWDDFQGDFDSIEDAEKKVGEIDDDWLQIVDTSTKQQVKEKHPDWAD